MLRSALVLLLSAHSCLAFVPALVMRPGLLCRGGKAVGGQGGRLGAAMRSNTRTARAGITSSRMGTSIPSVDVSKTIEFVQSVLAVGDDMPDAKELEVRLGLALALVLCPLALSLSSPPPPIPLSESVLLFSLLSLNASKPFERISRTRRRERYILVALHECATIHNNVFPVLAARSGAALHAGADGHAPVRAQWPAPASTPHLQRR